MITAFFIAFFSAMAAFALGFGFGCYYAGPLYKEILERKNIKIENQKKEIVKLLKCLNNLR